VSDPSHLPDAFRRWFQSRGWTPRAHQLDLLAKARTGRSVLLVAPTGAGKTLAGFLPTLVDLAAPRAADEKGRIHTLYISPLKALAVDIARNLEAPVAEMKLPIRIETRTGDTSAHKRARQIERRPTSCSPRPSSSPCCWPTGSPARCSQGSGAWCWTSSIRSSPRSAATSWP
jgi:ATP-dependent Lhr-like helicase